MYLYFDLESYTALLFKRYFDCLSAGADILLVFSYCQISSYFLAVRSIHRHSFVLQRGKRIAMSRLLDLPDELLHNIVTNVHPSASLPLASTCKRLHGLSGGTLRMHEAQASEYGVLYFDTCDHRNHLWLPRRGRHRHPVMFLAEVLEDPERLPYYPIEMVIEPTDYDSSESSEEDLDNEEIEASREAICRVIDAHRAELSKFALESPFITAPDRRENWRWALTEYGPLSEAAFISVLMTLLPNLQSVRITDSSDELEQIGEMVKGIAIANRDPTSKGYGKALTKLTQIALDRTDIGLGQDFGLYTPFAALPSMRSLHGNMIQAADLLYRGELSSTKSQVKTIRFTSSAVGGFSFPYLLANIDGLERFTYHHAGSMVGNAAYCVAGIVTALRQNASHSLQELDLTADQYWLSCADGEDHQWIGSLRSFQKLQKIRLDTRAFARGGTVERLVDMLPTSARVLSLVSDLPGMLPGMRVQDLFKDFTKEKEEKLPELREIVWEGEFPFQDETKEQFERLGIVLKCFDQAQDPQIGWEDLPESP